MSVLKPFNPAPGGTFIMANTAAAVSSSAAQSEAMNNQEQIAFYNSSATATTFVRVSIVDAPATAGTAATLTNSFPIPPGSHQRLTFGFGYKKISVISSAADGNLYVTPGTGV